MTPPPKASPELIRVVVTRFSVGIVGLILLLFLPAGTFRWWEAWLYLTVLLVPLLFAVTYLLRVQPDLLERRMRLREKEAVQRRILPVSWVFFLAAFIVPGLDHRFGWSDVPSAAVLVADALVLLGYLTVLAVFRANRYASRIVEVEEDQQVISSGPYARVRHPMYAGSLVLYLASPFALGSYWAFPFVLPIVWVIVARIANEEDVLTRELSGYAEYKQQVRYRLVPHVW
jgi:protein-S-isoprenylcysteine O-methyltransferase Ste14